MAIEVLHAMQSFSSKNTVAGPVRDLSDVYFYKSDFGCGVEKIIDPIILIKTP